MPIHPPLVNYIDPFNRSPTHIIPALGGRLARSGGDEGDRGKEPTSDLTRRGRPPDRRRHPPSSHHPRGRGRRPEHTRERRRPRKRRRLAKKGRRPRSGVLLEERSGRGLTATITGGRASGSGGFLRWRRGREGEGAAARRGNPSRRPSRPKRTTRGPGTNKTRDKIGRAHV